MKLAIADGYCRCGCGLAVPQDPTQQTPRFYVDPTHIVRKWRTHREFGFAPEKDLAHQPSNHPEETTIMKTTATAAKPSKTQQPTTKAAPTTSKNASEPTAQVLKMTPGRGKSGVTVLKAEISAPPAPKPSPKAEQEKATSAPKKTPQKLAEKPTQAEKKASAKAPAPPTVVKAPAKSKAEPQVTAADKKVAQQIKAKVEAKKKVKATKGEGNGSVEQMKLKHTFRVGQTVKYVGRNEKFSGKRFKVAGLQPDPNVGVILQFTDELKQSVSPNSIEK